MGGPPKAAAGPAEFGGPPERGLVAAVAATGAAPATHIGSTAR